MISQRRFAMLSLGIAVTVAAACSKPAPPPAPVPVVQPPNADSAAAAQARADSIRNAQRLADSTQRAEAAKAARAREVADSIARVKAAADAAARDNESMHATLGQTVHFDYDKADLRDDAKAALDAKIPILNANTDVMIRLAGHTDNRGSGGYNLALGQRRAAAARDYLVARGVATTRITLVSYGEERPVCQTEAEDCWLQNRRAEFEVTAGGTMLRKP